VGVDREEFEGFVQGHGSQLQRIAYLLTGSRDAETRLTHSVLVSTWIRWRDIEGEGGAETFALHRLVRAVLRDSDSPDDESYMPEDPEAAQRERLWRSLAELPPGERAVLVLDHLPTHLWPIEIDAGTVLGVRRAIALRKRAGAVGIWPEELIRATLEEKAAWLPSRQLTAESVFAAHRRRSGRAVVAAVVVLALGTGVAALSNSHKPVPSPAVPPPTPTVPPSAGTFDPGVIAPPVPWPGRGNLAGDADVVGALKVTFAGWYRNVVGDIQVLYAADLPGFRLALVAGRDGSGTQTVAWFYGPEGAPPERLERWTDFPVWMFAAPSLRLLPVAVHLEPDRVILLILGSPDVAGAEVSWAPLYAADGSARRDFEALPIEEGIAVVDCGGRPPQWVRVREAGGLSTLSPISVHRPRLERSTSASWVISSDVNERDVDQTLLWTTLTNLGDAIPVVPGSRGDLSLVVWAGTHEGEPVLLLRVARQEGGEFRIAAIGDQRNVASVARDAPGLPAAWIADGPVEAVNLWMITGPDSARVEFRQGDTVRASVEVHPRTLEFLSIRELSWFELGSATAVVKNARGAVIWSGTLDELVGHNVDVADY
jgi:hypothetical protein